MSMLVRILRHWPAVVVIVGAVGIAVTFIVAITGDWGLPGTAEYGRYEALSRRIVVSAAALLVGLLALRRRQGGMVRGPRTLATGLAVVGAGLVLAGNVGEFWLFTSTAYGSDLRNLAWTMFGVGIMTLVASAVAALVGIISDRIRPPHSDAR